jgi:geranylgeranyl pyrophosphate synthase
MSDEVRRNIEQTVELMKQLDIHDTSIIKASAYVLKARQDMEDASANSEKETA